MRRINRCLNTRIIEICKNTALLEELNTHIQTFLPINLKDHCHVGSFNKGCLLIVVSNAEWASQLRYFVPELRDKLRTEAKIYQLTSIKITIATINSLELTKVKISPSLSDSARSTIINSLDNCNYLPLKKALLKLASIDINLNKKN